MSKSARLLCRRSWVEAPYRTNTQGLSPLSGIECAAFATHLQILTVLVVSNRDDKQKASTPPYCLAVKEPTHFSERVGKVAPGFVILSLKLATSAKMSFKKV